MPLTQDEVDRFEDQGFLPREGLLTALEVKALHQRLEDIGNGLVPFPAEYVQIEPQVEGRPASRGPRGRFNNVRKIWNLTRYDALFREYARHPAILDVVRQPDRPRSEDLRRPDPVQAAPRRLRQAAAPGLGLLDEHRSAQPGDLLDGARRRDRGQRLHALHPRLPQAGRDRAQAPGGLSRRGRVRGLRKRGGRPAQGGRLLVPLCTAWPCTAPTPTPVPTGASA